MVRLSRDDESEGLMQGWKWQKDARESVEEVLTEALAAVNSKAEAVGKKVVVAVAGRTDKGVHAHRQVISFYTWDEGVTPQQVVEAINVARPGLLRAQHAQQMPRTFHAAFQATWRRYLYLFPLTLSTSSPPPTDNAGRCTSELPAALALGEEHPPPGVDASRVHRLLQPLVGQDLNYYALGRDTPPGKDCICRLLYARAWRCQLGGASRDGGSEVVLAVELVGTRFLRRMVRVLMATAVREAVPEAAWFPGEGNTPCHHSGAVTAPCTAPPDPVSPGLARLGFPGMCVSRQLQGAAMGQAEGEEGGARGSRGGEQGGSGAVGREGCATVPQGERGGTASGEEVGGAGYLEEVCATSSLGHAGCSVREGNGAVARASTDVCTASQGGCTGSVDVCTASQRGCTASTDVCTASQGGTRGSDLGSCRDAGAVPLNESALLDVLATMDRLRSAPPAPAVGLCFLEAGYGDWREHWDTT